MDAGLRPGLVGTLMPRSAPSDPYVLMLVGDTIPRRGRTRTHCRMAGGALGVLRAVLPAPEAA